tara:strand:+ start:15467 stop:15715 length:249 start_codon:yes stop_codon:yes gene_type:complete
MAAEKHPVDILATTLRRLELCSYAIQEIHIQLEHPRSSDEKADLILATEKMVSETIDLYQTVRNYVWGPEIDPEDEYIEFRD